MVDPALRYLGSRLHLDWPTLSWDEVRSDLDPKKFTIEVALARAATGDLLAGLVSALSV